jgi:hypothetical protein
MDDSTVYMVAQLMLAMSMMVRMLMCSHDAALWPSNVAAMYCLIATHPSLLGINWQIQ